MERKYELSCLIYSRKLFQHKIRSVCYSNPQLLVTWFYGSACVLSVTSLCSVGRPWKPQVFEDHLFPGNFLMGWLYRAAGFSLCLYVHVGYTPDFQARCSLDKADIDFFLCPSSWFQPGHLWSQNLFSSGRRGIGQSWVWPFCFRTPVWPSRLW